MEEARSARINGINGPILTVTGSSFLMAEMVYVGHDRLAGEVIAIDGTQSTIQVFEDTTGLRPGEEVFGTGASMSVLLGPGLLGNIFDGIQRPLRAVASESGIFLARGIHVDNLDTQKRWAVELLIKPGDKVKPGDIIAEVRETPAILHKIMVPEKIYGTVAEIIAAEDGGYTLNDTLAEVETENGRVPLKMAQRWPIRTPRPVLKRREMVVPLITGQRIIDTMFPIAKGGTAAIPGGFGTGKTITQHQLAKWSDADIIVYIGCGERGNEMTEVLEDFSKLSDPRTGNALMARTLLIANTSNMPVAAREASIYTGVTIAEYFRDMGYHVAIMADSTSRWAEALRELSGRLEEMPAEEGFPAYLASRLSGFYERAGYADNINGTEGSITIIGAVSPQGADFSEPVTQNTKRFVRCFWALDRSLAYARHFPAIHWLTSYSEYLDDLGDWYAENVSPDFYNYRAAIYKILFEESQLMEIVKLIGSDVLPDSQRLTLEIARVIRLGYVQQNAYHANDTYVSLKKQLAMMSVILRLNEACKKLLEIGMAMSELSKDEIFEKIIAVKYNVPNDSMEKFGEYEEMVDAFYDKHYDTQKQIKDPARISKRYGGESGDNF